MNDRDVLDVSKCAGRAECAGRVRACLTCQSVEGFGVRMNMSMGVLGHSELVGVRDGYRSMKLFGQNKSRTTHEAHPVKY